jgi:hypothetical protein
MVVKATIIATKIGSEGRAIGLVVRRAERLCCELVD